MRLQHAHVILVLSLLLRRRQRKIIKPRSTEEPHGPWRAHGVEVHTGSVGDREANHPLSVNLANDTGVHAVGDATASFNADEVRVGGFVDVVVGRRPVPFLLTWCMHENPTRRWAL
jgi:hypothetical protein